MLKHSMTNKVFDRLKKDIVNCVYSDDELITEAIISKKFNVSKTPAREALNHLCVEGLLTKIPYKGFFIKKISFNELQNLFQFRKILESACIELAVRFATQDDLFVLDSLCDKVDNMKNEINIQEYNDINQKFHITVAKLSKNPYLVSALDSVLHKLKRPLMLDFKSSDSKNYLKSHRNIVDHIHNRDLCGAIEEIKKHIDKTKYRLFS